MVNQSTHGTGRLVCSFSGYEECHNTEEILSAADYDPERDIDNPSDSVFCSHGAGFNVKWNDVPKYMHIPYSFGKPKNDDAPQSRRIFSECRNSRDIFALDKELMHIFEQTYGPVKRRQITESKVFTAPVNNDKQKNSAAKYDDDTEYLIVDGYNVIFSWDELKKISETNIDAARNTLINILCNYQGYKKCELILVFDAYKVPGGRGEVDKL